MMKIRTRLTPLTVAGTVAVSMLAAAPAQAEPHTAVYRCVDGYAAFPDFAMNPPFTTAAVRKCLGESDISKIVVTDTYSGDVIGDINIHDIQVRATGPDVYKECVQNTWCRRGAKVAEAVFITFVGKRVRAVYLILKILASG